MDMLSDLNLSNDKYYEVSREARLQRVRQTFGQLIVQHTLPAIKLQLPYVSDMICINSQLIL
jgi:transcription initiation factor TFIID subunit 1